MYRCKQEHFFLQYMGEACPQHDVHTVVMFFLDTSTREMLHHPDSDQELTLDRMHVCDLTLEGQRAATDPPTA